MAGMFSKNHVYGMVALKRFLPPDLVDYHIRPRLMESLPLWKLRDGQPDVIHIASTMSILSCYDVLNELAAKYENETYPYDSIEIRIYHNTTDRAFRHSISAKTQRITFTMFFARCTKGIKKIDFVDVWPS
jgi:hypothetical protein